jgi:DNA-3-methyladenine glycosylase
MDRQPLTPTQFLQPTLERARWLLGKTLVTPQGELTIVETEAYCVNDPACHAFRGKTKANAAMFGPPGSLYVHINYGVNHCMNIVCQPEGVAEAVLVRAVEPYDSLSGAWNGPGKLCKTLGIRKETHSGLQLCDPSGALWLAEGEEFPDEAIVQTTRIGITKGADLPWRFYVSVSRFVSRR